MSKYQAYPEYKDSGIEWINEIPAQWSSMGFGKAVQFMSNGASTTQVEESKDTVRVTRIETISAGVINLEKVGHVRRSDILPRFRLQKGDIQFSNINSLSMVGNCAIFDADEELFAGMNLLQIRPDYNRIHPQYMFYQLRTKWFRNSVEANAKPAINQASIPTGTLKQFGFLCPSLDEQEQIATFLDQETAKIDTLIDKQQQLIQLLKEKRQAVISRAVTKGLNPNAPMRDSGVEWLGEVPEHWDVLKINLLFSESSERAKTANELEYPVLSVSIHHGISDKELNEEELDRKVQRSEDRSLYKVVHRNYLAYNMMRAWQGGFGASKLSGLVSPAYVVCNPKSLMDSYYFELVLRTSNAVTELKRFSRGITDFRLRLYWDEFKNISIPVPPKSEIDEILKSISDTNLVYEKLVIAAEQQIRLLQERRTALISAAVTGKIDVRHPVCHPTGDLQSSKSTVHGDL